MNKALIAFLVATCFVVAFVEGQIELTKKNVVSYLKRETDLSETELNAKDLSELLDMAIGTYQKRIDLSRDEVRISDLKGHMAYYQGLKQGIYGKPVKPTPKPVVHVNEELMKSNVISYLKRETDFSEDELNDIELPELLDMAIATIQKRIDLSRDEVKISDLMTRIAYYQGMKDALNESAKRTGKSFPTITAAETKAMMVAYLKAQSNIKLSEAELNAKKVTELLDLAIGIVQDRLKITTGEHRVGFLKSRIAYYESLKEAFKGQ